MLNFERFSSEGDDTSIDLGEIARMIPDKMAFKIGEVAEIALDTHIDKFDDFVSEFAAQRRAQAPP